MVTKGGGIPYDRGWAWMIVVGGFFNTFLMIGLAKSFGLLVEQFIEVFKVSTAFAAMVMSVSGIVYAFAAPMCILLGEIFTARVVVMVGGVIALIGMSISSLLLNMSFVIVFLGIGFGCGNSSVFGNSLVMIGKYFKKRRTLANGIALAGASIGQFSIPPFIEFLLETYSLRGTLLILSAIYFHVMICGALFRPVSFYLSKSSKEDVFHTKEKGNHVTSAEETSNHVSDALISDAQTEVTYDLKLRSLMASTGSIYFEEDIKAEDVNNKSNEKAGKEKKESKKCFCPKLFDFSVMRRPITIFYVIVSFLCFFGHFNFVLFLPLHVVQKGIIKYNKAILLSVCGIGDLFGRLISGFVGDMNFVARYKIKVVAIIGVGVCILITLASDNFEFLTVMTGLYGFFGGVYVNYTSIVLIDFVGIRMMPKVLALVMLIQGSGAAAGQPLLGLLRDLSGSFDEVVVVCGVTAILGGLVLLCYPIVRKYDKVTELERLSEETIIS